MSVRISSTVSFLALAVAALMVLISLSPGLPVSGHNTQLMLTGSQTSSGALNSNTSGNSSLSLAAPHSNLSTLPVSPGSNWTETGRLITGAMSNMNIPSEAKLPPNFVYGPTKTNGSYTPLYKAGPAPMGLGSYGVYNSSGKLVNYTYRTSSFEGSLTVNNASELYLSSDSPTSYSIQLNSVLTNVTLFGKGGYQFWTQNVAFYNASSQSITFIDNIWNLSSPTAVINGNEFHNYSGTIVPGFYYYKIGPTIPISYPFTLNLFLNSTNIGGYNSVFFNYTLAGKNGLMHSGSYDRVEFNSTAGSSASHTPPAMFEVSGSKLTDTNFLPLDAELIIGGPGGGSTANFQNFSGTMNLYFHNGSGYSPVRSAYSVGSETGETSLGISEYYNGNTAYLKSGPSFVNGLWNISGASGYVTVSGSIAPSNAFIFLSRTQLMDNATAQWAPVSTNGNFSYRLQNGSYSLEALLSYHNPQFFNNLTKNGNITLGALNLAANMSRGLYTPLYAWDNAQLASLSIKGAGTASDPYVIPGPSYANSTVHGFPDHIMSVFSQVNDYLFPTFYGILTDNTTESALFTGFSSSPGSSAFQVEYPSSFMQAVETAYHGVMTNDLSMAFYDSSNIAVTNSTISGWFSSIAYYGYDSYNIPTVASLILWNTTHSILSGNTITSQGSGVLIYGTNGYSMGDYVWNNTFRNSNILPLGGYYAGAPIGLTVAASNNTIYNNIFNTTIPVVSISGPNADIYTGSLANYSNRFNITEEPSTAYKSFLGQNLTGSILGLGYQSGNFYYDYFGNGTQPYNGTGVGFAFNGVSALNGSISYTYDYSPLVLPYERTNVSAQGLPANQKTYLDINNAIYGIAPGNSAALYLPNGSYQLLGFDLVNAQLQFQPTTNLGNVVLTSGFFVVSGPIINLSLNYTTYYNLTVQEKGLPNGTLWGFSVPQASIGYTLTNSSQSLFVKAGAFDVLPQSVFGYTANLASGTLTGPATATIQYYNVSSAASSGNFSVIFTESGLSSHTHWGVNINGHPYTSNNSSFELIGVPSGHYTFTVISINGYTSHGSGSFFVNSGNASVSIVFNRSSSFMNYVPYIALGILVGAAAVAAINYFRKRVR